MHIGEYVKGGVATYIKEVIEFQRNDENISDIYLVLSETKSERHFNIENNNIISYKYKRSPKHFLKAMISIWKIINKIEPDIIHVHSTFAGVFVRFPLLFRKKKYKTVYCSHGWAFGMQVPNWKKGIYTVIERVLAFKTDKIINISMNEHKEALKRKIPNEKMVLIHNGISPKRNEGMFEYEIDDSKINLLFVGRFDRQKGLDILLEFFNTYNMEHIDLYIIGDSILENQKLVIPNNIKLIGWVENTKIDSYYSLFDAVIIPSRWEGFGLVAIEAMKNKKAIIVSDRGALPELVTESNGYVFDLDNLDTLKELLNTLNKEELVDKGLNGFNEFEKKYTSEKMNTEIVDLYKSIYKK
ncbi:TPA: glycosyltransferase [Bacillus cereus]|uniref:glycosyltransferase n=1 Tax=Bacillus TaxID=1386 RepID=UPI000864543F|nr:MULTISPECIES: glycosyltransferase [Bacillus]MCP1177339.1 glycosyltransferase [Bacillus sp. 1663tsa1]MCP1283256.1 glycosyltransferase [Bacillus sp. S0635]MCQ6347353.1 glycosyltransferase [Bacillus cereus]MCU5748498.1 glycosyltransferase [Bacillus cereus]SCN02184.1 Putative glycosyltransferase [Bacillus cereus]